MTPDIQALIRAGTPVDRNRLADTAVALMRSAPSATACDRGVLFATTPSTSVRCSQLTGGNTPPAREKLRRHAARQA